MSLQAVTDIKFMLVRSQIIVNIFTQIVSDINVLSLEIIVHTSAEHATWMSHPIHTVTLE